MLRRRFIAVVVGASLACLDSSGVPSTPPTGATEPVVPSGRAARPSVAAQLHLHGWSNHSGNSRPASIAWHTQQYAGAGVELIWWTDHGDIYIGRIPDMVVTPQDPILLPDNVWQLGTWGPAGQGRMFLTSTGRNPVNVSLSGSRATVSVPPGDSSLLDTLEVSFGI